MFKKAHWIWVEKEFQPDTYGEFYSEFAWEEGNVNCLLSCDGDYTLYRKVITFISHLYI